MSQVIKSWEELHALPASDTHTIKVNRSIGHGWIVNNKTGRRDAYLTILTFHRDGYACSTRRLQECGFDVVIEIGEDNGIDS